MTSPARELASAWALPGFEDKAAASIEAALIAAHEEGKLHSQPVMGGWRDIKSAPKDGTLVDLWAKLRERYVRERISDCQFIEGKWVHLRTIYDDETVSDMHEVYEVTHWRYPPSPPTPSPAADTPKEPDRIEGTTHMSPYATKQRPAADMEK